jgi:endo-1,4-beta-xylanase
MILFRIPKNRLKPLAGALLGLSLFFQAVPGISQQAKVLESREVYVGPDQSLPIDGGLQTGEVALTFDDGPDPVTTRQILKTLKKYGVRAVFFQVGRNAQNAPEVTREIIADGHSVGSHSWDHPDLAKLPLPDALKNIRLGHAAVEKAAGLSFHLPFFRFPHFSSTPELKAALQGVGLVSFHANIVTEDWMTPDPQELLAKSFAAVDAEKKGIVIFHDIQPVTAEILDEFLSGLVSRGYRTVVFRPRETLASLATGRGIRIGSSIFTPNDNPDPRGRATALREFNMFTMPAYFRIIQTERDRFDFGIPDQTIDFAPPGTVIRGHTLAWCELAPDWLKNGTFSGVQLKEILINHVTTVVQHYRTKYPGRVVAWDVVNEPFSWKGDKCLWNRIGLEEGKDELEYIRITLRTAHAADPDAKLFINDFLIEGMNAKSDSMYQLVTKLKSEGVPIHGVGMQSHFVIQSKDLFGELPPEAEVVQNMNRLAALGLETAITEADFSIKDSEVSKSTLVAQAAAYGALMRACLQSTGCKSFVTWGVGDKESWIPQFAPGWGTPLLFDSSYNAKPAYDAVAAALRGGGINPGR